MGGGEESEEAAGQTRGGRSVTRRLSVAFARRQGTGSLNATHPSQTRLVCFSPEPRPSFIYLSTHPHIIREAPDHVGSSKARPASPDAPLGRTHPRLAPDTEQPKCPSTWTRRLLLHLLREDDRHSRASANVFMLIGYAEGGKGENSSLTADTHSVVLPSARTLRHTDA